MEELRRFDSCFDDANRNCKIQQRQFEEQKANELTSTLGFRGFVSNESVCLVKYRISQFYTPSKTINL